MADNSIHTPRVKNFVKVAPSPTVSKINAFLPVMQKFKMGAEKMVGKQFLAKSGR